MTISKDVLAAGQQVSAAAPEAIGDALNAALNQFIGNGFAAGGGQIVDLAGATSDQFASVVHMNPAAKGPIAAPSDAVAAVIDVHDDLTLEHLRQSYGRIANAKSLTKTPVPQGETRTNITLGVVWAARTALPLDAITDEIALLNQQTPGTSCWRCSRRQRVSCATVWKSRFHFCARLRGLGTTYPGCVARGDP